MAKLGEVCDFYAGTGFPNEYQGRVTGKYPFYKVGDISKNVLEGNRELKTCANYVEEDVVQKLKGSILPPKTIVFAKIGEALKLNRRAITSCECLVDNNVMGIKAQNVRLNDEYLFYWLQNLNLSDYSESTTVPSVKKSRLQNIEINVSPLEEQEKVVSTLNKLSSLILARKKQLSKLDELVKARFVEMFGDPVKNTMDWEIKPLSELGELNRGVSKARPRNSPELLGGPYPLIQTGEVANAKTYITSFNSTYSEKGLAQSKMWPKGTLCITIAANIAQTSILTFDACFPDSVVGFISRNMTNELFIHYWFSFFQKILDEQAPQVAQKNINLKILSELNVIVPPLSLQNRFAAFVERVDQQKQTVQQSLEKLELMKNALMQEYFG